MEVGGVWYECDVEAEIEGILCFYMPFLVT
jgi:hypothetical protein